MISLGSIAGSVLIGLTLGVVAGFYGGLVDWIVMRCTDMVLCVPGLFIIMIMVAVFGPSFHMTIFVIAAVYWPSTARIVRAEFMKLRTQDFVESARALGAKDFRLIFTHLLPNATAPLIVQVTLQMAQAIVLESGLSYLGLGAQPPTPSWGNILADGHVWLRGAPWIATQAGMAIWITTLCFNFLGDGLRDALDPRQTM
jgi:peptide/nickel transport system permease protein